MCCCHPDKLVFPLGREICPGMLKTECVPVHGRHFSAVAVGIESQSGITKVSQEAQV